MILSVKSWETLCLGSLESVQQAIKNKKLEEELEKLHTGKGEFVHLMRTDASTTLLPVPSPARDSSVEGLLHGNWRNL